MVDSEAHEKRWPTLTSSKQDLLPQIANVSEMKHYHYLAAVQLSTMEQSHFPVKRSFVGICCMESKPRTQYCSWGGVIPRCVESFPSLMQKTTTLALRFALCEVLACLLQKRIRTPEFATRTVAAVLAGRAEAISTSLERVLPLSDCVTEVLGGGNPIWLLVLCSL